MTNGRRRRMSACVLDLVQYVSYLVLAGEMYEEDVAFVVGLSDVVKLYIHVLRALAR
jgi:hypothetical protein